MNGRSNHAETHRAPFLCGDWAVSPDTNQLSRGAQSVPVEPRVMDVLCLLADRAGQVVDSDELIREVWSGTVVGDDAVYRAVGQLRKALGDRAAGPTNVQTIPKRGYRLIADVGPEPSASPATVSGLAPGQAASASSPAHARELSKVRWQWLRSRRVLAQLNGQRGMLAQSLTFARRAEAFDPGGPITLAELARAYALLGELAQAAAALRRAEPSTTDNQGLLQALDPVYLATGDWEEYERLAEAVLQIATAADEASDDHRLRRSLARLGTAKFMLGDHQEAAQLLSRALSGNPAVISRPDVDTFFCSNLAHAYLALARHEDAKRTLLNCDERLQRAKTQGWRTSWIPYGEARIHIADGDRDAAVAALLALESTGAGVYFILDRDPIIATLRDDPEVAALLERMHEKVREERSKAQILDGS